MMNNKWQWEDSSKEIKFREIQLTIRCEVIDRATSDRQFTSESSDVDRQTNRSFRTEDDSR